MPYIKQKEREEMLAEIAGMQPARWTAGQLAYVVYIILRKFTNGLPGESGFFRMALAIGAIVLTVARYISKDVMLYEDAKEDENGSIEL